jgi:hypothetical protein
MKGDELPAEWRTKPGRQTTDGKESVSKQRQQKKASAKQGWEMARPFILDRTAPAFAKSAKGRQTSRLSPSFPPSFPLLCGGSAVALVSFAQFSGQ